MGLGDTKTWVSGTVALDGTADLATFTPGRPIRLRRFGYIWNSGTVTAPQTLDIDIDKRILIGDDTTRPAVATIAGASGEGQGEGAYTRVGAAGGGAIDVAADEEIVVQTTAGATAGDGVVFIEYEELPFANATAIGGNLTDRDA
jgi:hypothetical protein